VAADRHFSSQAVIWRQLQCAEAHADDGVFRGKDSFEIDCSALRGKVANENSAPETLGRPWIFGGLGILGGWLWWGIECVFA
jgi:hypothetical protein